MRYYSINIDGGPAYTSYVNGMTDLGALNVEMDLDIGLLHVPQGNSWVRIWGIPLTQIAQAQNLFQKNVTISGGMKKGLPLANAAQSGQLLQGQIIQSFGNWQGTDMTLEMYFQGAVAPSKPAPTQAAPANFTFNWPQGTPISSAIANTLNAALPGVTQNRSVSPKLIAPQTITGYYATVTQFAQFLNTTTKAIIGGSYSGVTLKQNSTTIDVQDGTTQPKTTMIAFTDMIGQATWIGLNVIQFKTVMRADISVGDNVQLPPGQFATTAQSMSQFRQGSVFNGTFFVQNVRHVGNFRSPNGDQWCSIFTVAGPVSSSAGGSS